MKILMVRLDSDCETKILHELTHDEGDRVHPEERFQRSEDGPRCAFNANIWLISC